MPSVEDSEKFENKLGIDINRIPRKMEKFKERWQEKIEEIKKQSFDKEQCRYIKNIFEIEKIYFKVDKKTFEVDYFLLQQIETDLDIALEIAFSKFRKEKRGFWSKIFGGNKEVTLFKPK